MWRVRVIPSGWSMNPFTKGTECFCQPPPTRFSLGVWRAIIRSSCVSTWLTAYLKKVKNTRQRQPTDLSTRRKKALPGLRKFAACSPSPFRWLFPRRTSNSERRKCLCESILTTAWKPIVSSTSTQAQQSYKAGLVDWSNNETSTLSRTLSCQCRDATEVTRDAHGTCMMNACRLAGPT